MEGNTVLDATDLKQLYQQMVSTQSPGDFPRVHNFYERFDIRKQRRRRRQQRFAAGDTVASRHGALAAAGGPAHAKAGRE